MYRDMKKLLDERINQFEPILKKAQVKGEAKVPFIDLTLEEDDEKEGTKGKKNKCQSIPSGVSKYLDVEASVSSKKDDKMPKPCKIIQFFKPPIPSYLFPNPLPRPKN